MDYTKDQINDMLNDLKPKNTDNNLFNISQIGSSYHTICMSAPWEDNFAGCEDN